jgi:bifunctional oligoribonuclease and PAP phosphatase NrnA
MLVNDQDFQSIVQLLRTSPGIIITSHHNPDGDAVGSAMALYHAIKKENSAVSVILPNSYPDNLSWIQKSEEILIFEKEDQNLIEQKLVEAQLVFCVDFNTPSRTGNMESSLRKVRGKTVLIDHHPEPDKDFFDYCFSDISASSTAELIYTFLQRAGLSENIDKAAAESLYAGIITDTGSFSFSCNNAVTYRIMADLITKGVDAERLHRLIYDNFSEERLRMLGYAFYEKMLILKEFKTAIIAFNKNELSRFNNKPGDTEGIVNYPLSIKDIIISIMISERGDHLRLSFRSKGDFAVNKIAKAYFDGGGHRNAAGGYSYLTTEATIQKIKEILPLFIHDIQNTNV